MALHKIGFDEALTGASDEQRRVFDVIARGPRGCVPSPFLAMLDAPRLAEAIQQVGVMIRYHSTLSADQREVAILTTAGAAGCGYEWHYHLPIALQADVPQEVIDRTRPNAEPAGVLDHWNIIVQLCREVTQTRGVCEELLDSAIERFGRQATTELIAISGYYALLAGFIKAGGHDRPF